MDNMDGKRRVIVSEATNFEEYFGMLKQRRRVIVAYGDTYDDIEKMMHTFNFSTLVRVCKFDVYQRRYDITTNSKEKVMYCLLKGKDGYNPTTDVLLDKEGNVITVDYL